MRRPRGFRPAMAIGGLVGLVLAANVARADEAIAVARVPKAATLDEIRVLLRVSPPPAGLDLARQRRGDDFLRALGESREIAGVRVLRLASNGLHAAGLAAFLTSPYLGGLEELDLADNDLDDGAMKALAAAPLRALRLLRVRGNPVSPAGIRALLGAEWIAKIASLDLSGVRLGPEAPAIVRELAVHAAALREIDLHDSSCENACVDALVVSPLCGRLKSLRLGYDAIDRRGASALAASRCFSSLESLALLGASDVQTEGAPRRFIDARGARAIAASKHLRSLRELRLPLQAIGDAGAVALAGARWPALEVLDLRQNDITDRGALALAAAKFPPVLRSIDLSGARVSVHTRKRLEERFGSALVLP